MKKVLVVASLVALAVLAIASMPSSVSARGDKDCADFSTQRKAQIFFLKHGGPRYDPDRLDGDDDGIACEDNPCPCYRKKHLPRRPAARTLSADWVRAVEVFPV